MLKKLLVRAGVPAVSVALAAPAFATAPATVGDLATGIDFSSVGLAILAVAAAVIALYLTWKGAKFVVHAVKGA